MSDNRVDDLEALAEEVGAGEDDPAADDAAAPPEETPELLWNEPNPAMIEVMTVAVATIGGIITTRAEVSPLSEAEGALDQLHRVRPGDDLQPIIDDELSGEPCADTQGFALPEMERRGDSFAAGLSQERAISKPLAHRGELAEPVVGLNLPIKP